jgi:SOS regulatory protein LexA
MKDLAEVPSRRAHAGGAPRRRAYADLRDFLLADGRPANVYEVCDSVELKVSYRLRALRPGGQPRSSAGRLRAAWERQVGYHPVLHVHPDDVPEGLPLPSQIGAIVLVPVYGWIPAGPLNLAGQAFESAFLLDKRPVGDGTLFMLKVVGDSMTDAGIADGNWVVVRQQEDARNGEIVAAMVDGEVTVKTLHREPGTLELVPQNPDYEPIPVTDLKILGTVVGVVHQALPNEGRGRMGPGGEIDLSLLAELADAAAQARDAAGARQLYAALLQAHQQVSGPKHPDTLTAQYNVAHWTGEAGNPAGACTQLVALRELLEQLYGPDDEDTLALGAKHAYWTWQAGHVAAARDLYAALLPAMFGAMGREHPFVLAVRAQFATCTALAGDVIEALRLFSVLVPETGRALGADHPETLAARTSLAAMTDQTGDKAGARRQLNDLLPLARQRLGPRHPITHAARGNLIRLEQELRR